MVGLRWKIPLKWMIAGGTPISGNFHLEIQGLCNCCISAFGESRSQVHLISLSYVVPGQRFVMELSSKPQALWYPRISVPPDTRPKGSVFIRHGVPWQSEEAKTNSLEGGGLQLVLLIFLLCAGYCFQLWKLF